MNPHGLAFLTNANAFGGDNFTQEIYHGWFGDGTAFDGGITPYLGPPPAFIPGGVNKDYQPDATYTGPPISPPQNQPVQKSYKDWNTSFPENSWEISEVGIYVNAAYVKLLSKFADSTSVTSVENISEESDFIIYPNPASTSLSVISSEARNLLIYNSLGQEIRKAKLFEGKNIITLSDLPEGIYFCKIFSEGFIETEKIIISR